MSAFILNVEAQSNDGVLMFNLYQHRQYPEYRLISPHGSKLPNEITDEWALAETAISIEGGLEKEIGPGGYHLYKSSRNELKRGVDAS